MVRIRAATADDIVEIVDIYNALLDSTTYEWTELPHTVEERHAWLVAQEAAERPALVAVEGGRVLGWATYGDFRDSRRRPGYRFTVEHTIHVHRDAWGRGVGRALLAALVEHAQAAGKREMIAAIDSANEGSIAFHTRLGFDQVGYLPGIGDKWGQRLDLVLMQLDLGGPST